MGSPQTQLRQGAVLVLLALALGACEKERRVPRIPPDLHRWERPYRGVAGLRMRVFVTGFVRQPSPLARSAHGRSLPVLVFVISHPRHGLTVFNTGLAPQSGKKAGRSGGLFGVLRPEIEPGAPLDEQLRGAGIDPDQVRTVVLGNLRPAQRGNIGLFRRARIVLSAAELAAAREREADVVAEIDGDREVQALDFEPPLPLGTFRAHHDLLGDRSLLIVDARGATPGTLALLVRLPERPVLLADALAPTAETARYAAQPAHLDDADAWWDNIWRLKRFADLAPELLVVPQAGLDTLESAALQSITVQPYKAPPTPLPPTPTRAVWMPALPP